MRSKLLVVSMLASCMFFGCADYYNSRRHPMLRKYTHEQWMSMITQSQHQPVPIWQGWSDTYITKTHAGSSGGILHLSETPARILERQARGLLEQDPLFFWPALMSDDKRVLQTGLYVYDRYMPRNLGDDKKQQIYEIYRKLLSHQDTSMRAMGISKLREYRQLTVSDVEKGLSDPVGDVRFTTCFALTSAMFRDSPVYNEDGTIYKGTSARADELIEIKRKLAPIFLERLNDPRPSTRSKIAGAFVIMLRRKVYTGTGIAGRILDSFPAKIDWRRASWHECEETKEIWTKWWAERGEDALKFAHPPQNE